jgi:hypothetical protein
MLYLNLKKQILSFINLKIRRFKTVNIHDLKLIKSPEKITNKKRE